MKPKKGLNIKLIVYNKLVKANKGIAHLFLLVIVIFVAIGAVGYLAYQNAQLKKAQPDLTQPTTSPEALPSITPSEYLEDISLGGTTISYAVSDDWILIKTNINLVDEVFEYSNSKLRTVERIYSQDAPYYDPKELTYINASDYSWIDLVSRKMENTTNAKSIHVSDHLFSFKQIPDSDSFLFVVEWSRSASDSEAGPWSPTINERVLYLFNGSKVTEVMTFDKDSHQYAYPKIDMINSNGRYVSLKLFGCWGCGGHQPETLLLNLQSLESRNIGKILEFAWTLNGGYQYKDYVVVECEEPGPGECRQDPDTLPLKTGSF